MTPRRNLLLNSHLQALLVVIIVVLANGFAAFHVARVDLSQERLYTLDEASKQIVQQMDRPIVARVYYTHGLGAPYQNHEQFIADKLEEFAAYSHGRMTIERLDPASDTTIATTPVRRPIEPVMGFVRYPMRSAARKTVLEVSTLTRPGRE